MQGLRSFAALLALHVRESERNSKKEKERKFKRLEEIFLVEIRPRFCSIFLSAQYSDPPAYLSVSRPVDSITFSAEIRICFRSLKHSGPESLQLYRNSDQRYSNILYSAFVFGSKTFSQFLWRNSGDGFHEFTRLTLSQGNFDGRSASRFEVPDDS